MELAQKFRYYFPDVFLTNMRASQKIGMTFVPSIHAQVVFCTGHAGIPLRLIRLYFSAHFFDPLRRLFMLMGLVNVLGHHDDCMRGLADFVVRSFQYRAFRPFVSPRLAVGKEDSQ